MGENSFEKKLSVSKFEGTQDLYSLWKQEKEGYEKLLDRVNFIFPHYSSHDKSHSETIAENLTLFIGDKVIDTLSVSDLWYLLVVIYLHDCGMALDSEKEIKLWEKEDFQVYLNKLTGEYKIYLDEIYSNNHTDKAWPARIKNYITYITAEYVRSKHAQFSADKIDSLVNINNIRIKNHIKNTICSHTWDKKKMLQDIPIEEDGLCKDHLHPLLLSIFLRIGDLLDIDCDRFNNKSINIKDFPIVSKTHIRKHEELNHKLLANEVVELDYRCSSKDVFSEARDWIKYLESEVNLLVQIWDIIAPNKCRSIKLPMIKAKLISSTGETETIQSLNGYIDERNLIYNEFCKTNKREFEYIFSLKNNEDMNELSIEDIIPKSGSEKVILEGSSGSGKSEVLRRIFCSAHEKGYEPIMINIKNVNKLLEINPDGYNNDVEFKKTLFKAMQPYIDSYEILLFRINHKIGNGVLLIIDGINELSSECFLFMTQLLEDIENEVENFKLLISSQKSLMATPFYRVCKQITIQELDDLLVEKFFEAEGGIKYKSLKENLRSIMKIPFFFDLILKNKLLLTNSIIEYDIFVKYMDNIGISGNDIINISNALYSCYENSIINSDRFGELLDPIVKNKLLNEGEVLTEEIHFTHDLWKEFFNSVYLIKNIDYLSHSVLDNVTNHSKNMESVYMTIKQLDNVELKIKFLIYIYDWNYTESAKCINYIESNIINSNLNDTKMMIYAAIAEKIWDRISKTNISALNLLKNSSDNLANDFSKCKSKNDCNIIVNGYTSTNPMISNWKKVYCDENCCDYIMEMLLLDDSIMGWTAANHIRRMKYQELDILLCEKYTELKSNNEKDTIRWRIVHALGAYPSEQVLETLFDAFNHDSYIWVRYGAARSIIEIAANNENSVQTSNTLDNLRKTLLTIVWGNSRSDYEILRNGVANFCSIREDESWKSQISNLMNFITN